MYLTGILVILVSRKPKELKDTCFLIQSCLCYPSIQELSEFPFSCTLGLSSTPVVYTADD